MMIVLGRIGSGIGLFVMQMVFVSSIFDGRAAATTGSAVVFPSR